MAYRERRSVSLGRNRDRAGSRDPAKPIEEDLSTRHNISNFLLTLQRVQASEEENRLLRKENDLLRQRVRAHRLSSASFKNQNSVDNSEQSSRIVRDTEDEKIAADVKRNSLIFVGDSSSISSDHSGLEAQYNKLQEDFQTVKEFLKQLFQHALTMSASENLVTSYKDVKDRDYADVNTFNPLQTKQLERSLEDIHGQITQLRNSQENHQVKMEQVLKALDNVLCQSSVRNDVTMRIVRQQDKVKELTNYCSFLESQLMSLSVSLRQAEEKAHQAAELSQRINNFAASNNKNLKGNTKDEMCRFAEQLSYIGQVKSKCACKMAAINKLLSYITAAANQKQTLAECKPPADVVDTFSKLERLIGSDWHRLGRMLGLNPDCLDDIGKFTNFDLTSRVEKVLTTWAKQTRGANTEGLRQGLDRMDRDIFVITEQPVCKDWQQLPPEVQTYIIAHLVDVPSIISQLSEQGILSQDSRVFILDATEEHRRASRMLQSVVYMGPPAICALCTALDGHSQTLIANKIRGCLPGNVCKESSSSPFYTPDYSNKAHIEKTRNHLTATATKMSSTLSTPASVKPDEKPRKKRSRSLFSRKNKNRDNETEDSEVTENTSEEFSHYYPAINVHILNSSSSTSGDSSRNDKLPPPGPQKRQYGRQQRSTHGTKSSSEVIV